MTDLLVFGLLAAAAGALLVLIGNQVVALWRLHHKAAEEAQKEKLEQVAAHNRAVIIRDLTLGKL